MTKRNSSIRWGLILVVALSIAGIAVADHSSEDVALGGYCPVAYAAMGKAVKGDAQLAVEYEGQTYYLANAKAQQMFDKEPQKYVVAYDGLCAAGLAKGMKMEADPTVFVVHDGTTYLFSSEEAKAMFEMDATEMVAMADKNWKMESTEAHNH
jgi:YHS domain-containing protein